MTTPIEVVESEVREVEVDVLVLKYAGRHHGADLAIARALERLDLGVDSGEHRLDDFNPNVFLEVGYAWGLGKPTVLILREGVEPPFDVQSHRILRYSRLGELRKLVERELAGLVSAGSI